MSREDVTNQGKVAGGPSRAGEQSRLTRLTLAPLKIAPWHRLPRWIGAVTLIGIRDELRRQNLHDTGSVELVQPDVEAPKDDRYLRARTVDGSYNDLESPRTGAAGSRFGRNVPLAFTYPEAEPGILQPNPRVISRELMTRSTFLPATSLNVLAAAWIQFNVHDWMTHGENQIENPWQLELDQDDPWVEERMRIQRTRQDPTHGKQGTAPTYTNAVSHWWDASQLYGADTARYEAVRTWQDGKLKVGENGLLPLDASTGLDLTGFTDNYWVGLSALHTLFTLEHNAVCDMFRQRYTQWSDQDIYDHARLVIAALIAKIHTVEWTTGILSHPTVVLGMRANWWGLQGSWLHRRFGRLTESEVLSGIPGSDTNHHGAPYAITEEFVAVYRLHPLMPEDFVFRSAVDDTPLMERKLMEVQGAPTRAIVEQLGMRDVLYSLGTSHPGQIRLHNYPRAFQALQRQDGTIVDLAATEILRDRERGVPRYNAFRKFLHLEPVKTFEELTDNPRWVEQLRRIYDNDIERVDTLVGLLAEPLPAGFGFSETAFRIFVLMASRRLKSDRFFTNDYRPEVYTKEGLAWVEDNTMSTVLLRHYPQLQRALQGVENAFGPWSRV